MRPDGRHIDSAERYGRLQTRWALIASCAEAGLLTGIVLLERHVARPAAREAWFAAGPWTYAALLSLSAAMLYMAVMLPIDFYRMFTLRQRFGLANESRLKALRQVGAALCKRVALVIFLALAVLLLRQWSPGLWWAGIICLIAGKRLLARLVRPKVLGYHTYRLKDEEKLRPLQELARRHGSASAEIRGLRAAGLGLEVQAAAIGSPKRPKIYLSDNLLDLLSDRELLAVFAHELGHCKGRHLRWQTAMTWVSLLVAMFFAAVLLDRLAPEPWNVSQAVRAGPTILLVTWIVLVMLRPATLYLWRRQERLANAWALRATNDPAAFISAMSKIAQNNLVTGRPGWIEKLLLNTHPSLEEMLIQAGQYARRKHSDG